MAKDRVVLFTPNNARILKGPDAAPFKGHPDALVNPDMSKVYGIPPHHWKRRGSEIVPMDLAEREERDRVIARFGVKNGPSVLNLVDESTTNPPVSPTPSFASVYAILAAGAAGALAALLVLKLFGVTHG
jgi:hypothetical protein